jgi:hypothetical protein
MGKVILQIVLPIQKGFLNVGNEHQITRWFVNIFNRSVSPESLEKRLSLSLKVFCLINLGDSTWISSTCMSDSSDQVLLSANTESDESIVPGPAIILYYFHHNYENETNVRIKAVRYQISENIFDSKDK